MKHPHPMAGETFTAEDMGSAIHLGIARGLRMAADVLATIEVIDRAPNNGTVFTGDDFCKAVAATHLGIATNLRESAKRYDGTA